MYIFVIRLIQLCVGVGEEDLRETSPTYYAANYISNSGRKSKVKTYIYLPGSKLHWIRGIRLGYTGDEEDGEKIQMMKVHK